MPAPGEANVEIASKLHPPRLPADFAVLSWQDCVAGFGAGVLLAILLYAAVLLFLRPGVSRRAVISDQLKSMSTLEPQERLFRQARLLASLDGSLRSDMIQGDALYRPGCAIDHGAIDAGILRLCARRAG